MLVGVVEEAQSRVEELWCAENFLLPFLSLVEKEMAMALLRETSKEEPVHSY